MAKGNMLQGMARGKVGDVVFSRLDGEQIARVRNRHPKNPRSNAQLFQRAIMATVMQAYSAGKVIFDHAFQGKGVGAENQRRFMTLNAKLLRSQIAADIDGNVAAASQVGRVVAPGSMYPVPATLIVSEGTYEQSVFTFGASAVQGRNCYKLPSKNSNEKLSEYASRVGLIPGDVYTFVGFCANINDELFTLNSDNTKFSKQFGCEFTYARLTVKEAVATSQETTFTLGDIFDIESSPNTVPYTYEDSITEEVVLAKIWPAGWAAGSYPGTMAMIRSRKDQDLRSNTQLQFSNSTEKEDWRGWGITSSFAIDAWKQGTAALGNSDLILEGAKFDGKKGQHESGD